LSTEPGVFGGLPASGHNFGPAYNASSMMEMNQMFDFYDGGGLDMTFLGCAQVSPKGDVNVSRLTKNKLTGPGGFIDISQCTKKICFMMPMTAKGLKIGIPGDGTLKIESEGSVKKFVPEVYEITFSGDEAVRRGQEVIYVTERAVFTRTGKHDKIELIEIAAGVDLQKDILDQMEFEPIVSPNLKTMDPRIYMPGKMNVTTEILGSLEERFNYDKIEHTMFLDLFGITLNTEDDVEWFAKSVRDILTPLVEEKGPIDMVVNYDGFDLSKGLESIYGDLVGKIQNDLYKSAKRYTGQAFQRAQLQSQLNMKDIDPNQLFDDWDTDGNGTLCLDELRRGFEEDFSMQLTPQHIRQFKNSEGDINITRQMFAKGVAELLS
jgi:propionate CoA-transferase